MGARPSPSCAQIKLSSSSISNPKESWDFAVWRNQEDEEASSISTQCPYVSIQIPVTRS